jgi:hypothetical protein
MCGTSYWAMDEKGYLIREEKLKTELAELRAAALRQTQFIGASTVMRQSVRKHFPDFYRNYFINAFADADLACLILDQQKATNIPESLYFYRIVRNSDSRRKKMTVRNLNIHLLIGFLSGQRKAYGKDCLQRNASHEADEFMKTVQVRYDADKSLIFRHQAFFHLYWRVNDLAFQNGLKAFSTRPLYWKNILSLGLIVFRIGVFLLTRGFNKKHYSQLINP